MVTTCDGCGKAVTEGQIVRALGGCFHLACFTCRDCGLNVADRFFPIDSDNYNNNNGRKNNNVDKVGDINKNNNVDNGRKNDNNDTIINNTITSNIKMYALCEKDFFRRMGLECGRCGGALRGSYVLAAGRKFHIEHFACGHDGCPVAFAPDDAYYETGDGNVLCLLHYALLHARPCCGCRMPILKHYISTSNNTTTSTTTATTSTTTAEPSDVWHPECYMVYTSWNIVIDTAPPLSATQDTVASVALKLKLLEEKVNRIWSVLAAFEESTAACISDLLMHVSNDACSDALHEAARFILHVDLLFSAIDRIDLSLQKYNDDIGIPLNREPKQLAKKIANFFSLISHSTNSGLKHHASMTQELLALVTSLAQYLKLLIRVGLAGALKLEKDHNNTSAIGDFLAKLSQVTQHDNSNESQWFDQCPHLADIDVQSDLCAACRNTIEDSCIRHANKRWHEMCCKCHLCRCGIVVNGVIKGGWDTVDEQVVCEKCSGGRVKSPLVPVRQLDQYVFLLKVALKRLYGLLKVKDDYDVSKKNAPKSSTLAEPQSSSRLKSSVSDIIDGRAISTNTENQPTNTFPSTIHTQPISPEKKLRVVRNPHKTDSIHNIVEILPPSTSSTQLSPTKSIHGADHRPRSTKSDQPSKSHDGLKSPPAADLFPSSPAATAPTTTSNRASVMGPKPKHRTFTDLTALEIFVVRHLALLKLHPFVSSYYSLSELAEFIGEQKVTLWSKIFSTLKPAKKPVKFKHAGTFGVPLDVLIDKCGVESKYGSGLGRVRVPAFLHQSIVALNNLSVEGIFRKNGNIRQLNILQEKIDSDPFSVDLAKDTPIQVAALLKKFFRDLPEPLLTFRLYKLFILSQKLGSDEHRRKALVYTCCLLPKPNRDTLEVLLCFLQDVARHAQSLKTSSPGGNKMDLSNLATVMAPNILYAKTEKSERETKDESFLAIAAVKMLLDVDRDVLWGVPEDIAEILEADMHQIESPASQSSQYGEMSTKAMLKKYEPIVSMKKSHSSRDFQVSGSVVDARSTTTIVKGKETPGSSAQVNRFSS